MKRLLEAAAFAARKHAKQRRMNKARTPYVNHTINVALHLANVGEVEDEEILMAALLHDTVEDTDTEEDELRAAFGDRVTNLVLECTDDKKLPKQDRKRLQIENAPHKSGAAKMIKLADKTDNLRSILHDPPSIWDTSRQAAYFTWASQVVAGLSGVNPPLDAAMKELLREGEAKFGLELIIKA